MIVYLCDYKMDEEAHLRDLGVRTVRVDGDLGELCWPQGGIEDSTSQLIRGPKLTLAEYTTIFDEAKAHGWAIGTTPGSFELGTDLALQGRALAELAPASAVFGGTISPVELRAEMSRTGIKAPAFVRSNVESAAKYVGIDGCMVGSDEAAEYEKVVDNLRQHVQRFEQIIVKEVVSFEQLSTGNTAEYRAICHAGQLLSFDDDPFSIDELDLTPSDLEDFVGKVLERLYSFGGVGGFFVDVGVTTTRKLTVVECKNLLNGTIRNVEGFARSLADED